MRVWFWFRMVIGVVLVIYGLVQELIITYSNPDVLPARKVVDNIDTLSGAWIAFFIGIVIIIWALKTSD